jgi:glyoxylase-like metal-dependent hydrolase (beta-lactamase superfamily II)
MTAKLTWGVFVGPPAPLAGDEARPGQMERTWSPISATLISGQHDAVLIDALLAADQGRDLADWVAARGKNLASVYATHGHGDHSFGLGSVLDRFPDAKAFALPAVIEQMRKDRRPSSSPPSGIRSYRTARGQPRPR